MLFAVGILIPTITVKPSAALIVALLLGGSYLMQRHRFVAVDSAVRRLMMTGEPQRLVGRDPDRADQRR
ncbi:hypothetical protein [Lysobacter sp. Root96]|uniref:hypothetical protein n=1 Tax=Lysobacter sp. Root96 TaxID=1736612 RepID=UPI0006F2D06A|nr:hypothetical protein [Lysobacter sp. Root96]KRC31518.1 hypothetical protein ASE10_17480 [Lysobacter sp. Root76]KRD65425.1 hypothetical protein ASE45_18675 [Lysobacter sp. Root96]